MGPQFTQATSLKTCYSRLAFGAGGYPQTATPPPCILASRRLGAPDACLPVFGSPGCLVVSGVIRRWGFPACRWPAAWQSLAFWIRARREPVVALPCRLESRPPVRFRKKAGGQVNPPASRLSGQGSPRKRPQRTRTQAGQETRSLFAFGRKREHLDSRKIKNRRRI